MLSILIPAYNQNIVALATDLHQQAIQQYIDFEIIVLEDGSTQQVEENKRVSNLGCCRHIIRKENSGRSAARNALADEAKYDHLLFIDCDAKVNSEHFIEKYLSFCKEECIVIGGTEYDEHENRPVYSLRLKYGRKREARPAPQRSKNNFATFNFLISKSIFNRVRFDETMKGYGHEDMLFGHHLHQLGYKFIQIDNPLIHEGLDDNLTFISKTEEATRNLYLLYRSGRYPFLTEESKLLRSFLKLQKADLSGFLSVMFDVTRERMCLNLCSPSPSLFIYDLYKLLFLCKTAHPE